MARTMWGGFVNGLRPITAAVPAVTLAIVVAAAQADIQTLADQVIRKLDLQTDLPLEQLPTPPLSPLPIPKEVLWIVILIAIAVLLYAFRDLIPGLAMRRRGSWSPEDMDFGDGRAGTPAAALGAADQFAAEGRFVEAMHVLLLQSLAAIRERLDEQFADSLTSREILRSTRLPEAGRTPLRDIINRVELTYFGAQPAALADYVACRASFNALAQTLHGYAAA